MFLFRDTSSKVQKWVLYYFRRSEINEILLELFEKKVYHL